MSRHVEAWINGQSIFSASPLVILREPRIEPAEVELTTGERPGAPGALLVNIKRTRLTVALGFVLRNIFDLAARSRALEQVNAWARDGVLTLSSMPFRQLQMVVTKRAAMGAIRDYNTVYTIECAAVACPFWQDTAIKFGSASGTSGTINLYPAGSVDRMPLEFTVTPASETLTSFTIAVNGRQMAFSGFSLPAGQELKVFYDAQMLQWITLNGVSSQGARTRASADNLYLYPNQINAVTFSAGAAVTVQAGARGLYL